MSIFASPVCSWKSLKNGHFDLLLAEHLADGPESFVQSIKYNKYNQNCPKNPEITKFQLQDWLNWAFFLSFYKFLKSCFSWNCIFVQHELWKIFIKADNNTGISLTDQRIQNSLDYRSSNLIFSQNNTSVA